MIVRQVYYRPDSATGIMGLQGPGPGVEIWSPGMGAWTPGFWHSPENPVIQGEMMAAAECGGGLGCGGCGGRCRGGELSPGMGAWNFPDLSGYAPYIIGGLAILVIGSSLFFRSGRKAYQEELTRAKRDYQDKVSRIREKYPRYGRRISRAAQAAAGAF